MFDNTAKTIQSLQTAQSRQVMWHTSYFSHVESAIFEIMQWHGAIVLFCIEFALV